MEGTATVPYKELLEKELKIIELEKKVNDKIQDPEITTFLKTIIQTANDLGVLQKEVFYTSLTINLTKVDMRIIIELKDGSKTTIGSGKKIILLKSV